MANWVGNGPRRRDWVLLACSAILQVLAVWYKATFLAWVGAAAFWLAVLDSTRHQPRGSRIVAAVASAFLLAMAVLLVTAVILMFRPPVAPIAPIVIPAVSVPPR